MFDLRKIPLLRVLAPFFGGVLSGLFSGLETPVFILIILLLILWVLTFVFFRCQRRYPHMFSRLISLLLCVIFYLSGLGTGIQSRPLDPGLKESQPVLIRGELISSPKPGPYAFTFDLQLNLLCHADTLCITNTLLKCYLDMPEDSLMPSQGETWQFSGMLVSIRSNRNPGMPDYRAIMGRKNCWYRFYISSNPTETGLNKDLAGKKRVFSPARIRTYVSEHWEGPAREVSLLKAVCLGDRSSLTDDMRQAYSAAGGMHLLAVSGLHVGLIWWVLQYATRWMSLIFRKNSYQIILVVSLLWFYAFTTGFSSSVCRAVTMFSFFSVSRMMGQTGHPLNALTASAFLLVLLNPMRLTDVGFQLSYAAMIGILTLHPKARRLVRTKFRILQWVWEASSLSFAAQLFTAPFVIYYFHQIPVYSLVTSLLAIPLLSMLIAIFVCSVPFVFAGILIKTYSFMLLGLARLMNLSVDFLSSLPGAVVDGLQLNRISLLAWTLLMLLAMIALHGRKRRPCYLILFLFSGILFWNSYSTLKRRSSSELVISHFRGASLVSHREGDRVDHYCWTWDSTSWDYMKLYQETAWNRRIYKNSWFEPVPGEGSSGRTSASINLAPGVYLLGGEKCHGLVFTKHMKAHMWDVLEDCSGSLDLQADFILLSGEPERAKLQEYAWIKQAVLVIDGSNRNWYKMRALDKNERFYLTDQSGAYVKRW